MSIFNSVKRMASSPQGQRTISNLISSRSGGGRTAGRRGTGRTAGRRSTPAAGGLGGMLGKVMGGGTRGGRRRY